MSKSRDDKKKKSVKRNDTKKVNESQRTRIKKRVRKRWPGGGVDVRRAGVSPSLVLRIGVKSSLKTSTYSQAPISRLFARGLTSYFPTRGRRRRQTYYHISQRFGILSGPSLGGHLHRRQTFRAAS